MDRREVSISTAAEIADLPKQQQVKRLKLPSKQKALAQSKATGKAVLANDGKYHYSMRPAEKEKWLCRPASSFGSQLSACATRRD
jgi:hypothetical protein